MAQDEEALDSCGDVGCERLDVGRESLTDKLASLPAAPGCYLMKNSAGVVIYVGKAKQLRSRVRSYFQKGAELTRHKRRMVYEITNLDTIVTDSELEALILESTLIKKHHPVYNVRLRDDKSYPYIAITLSEEWPRPVYMRKLRMQPKEKDKYFGPYTDIEAVRETLRLIRRVFRVPCGYKDPAQSRGKACMYYHIGQCTGVCSGKVTHDEYMSVVKDVMAFLEGKQEQLVNRMLKQMESASEDLEFERAARLRDQVQSIQKLIARQKVISTAFEDQDVIALVTDTTPSSLPLRGGGGEGVVEMFFVRGGKLIGQEHFLLENASAEEAGESLGAFVERYYDTAAYIPREVLLSAEIEEMDVVETWLRQKRGSKVELSSPKRGEKKRLVEMASKNAELVLKQLKLKMATDEVRVSEELEALRDAIRSDALPRRIEAYDISNIQGYHTVASLVVFENGQPKKAHYRKFKIQRPDGQPDDYASMREVISRRLTGTLRKGEAFAGLPDLMLIDGGKGQLSAALEAAAESGEWRVESGEKGNAGVPPVIGLAKRNEEIFLPANPDPVILPRNSKALHLLQRIRDEAHRFAVTYHRNVRGKTVRASILNSVPGIGAKRRRALIRHFSSVERIKQASVDELQAAPSMSKSAAEAVFGFFHPMEE